MFRDRLPVPVAPSTFSSETKRWRTNEGIRRARGGCRVWSKWRRTGGERRAGFENRDKGLLFTAFYSLSFWNSAEHCGTGVLTVVLQGSRYLDSAWWYFSCCVTRVVQLMLFGMILFGISVEIKLEKFKKGLKPSRYIFCVKDKFDTQWLLLIIPFLKHFTNISWSPLSFQFQLTIFVQIVQISRFRKVWLKRCNWAAYQNRKRNRSDNLFDRYFLPQFPVRNTGTWVNIELQVNGPVFRCHRNTETSILQCFKWQHNHWLNPYLGPLCISNFFRAKISILTNCKII